MSKQNNLTDFLESLATKIRSILNPIDESQPGSAEPPASGEVVESDEGEIQSLSDTTSTLINPQDFESKIDSIYQKGKEEGGPANVTATAADVVEGKTFGSGGPNIGTGTLTNRTEPVTATSSSYNSNLIRLGVPLGAYQIDTTVDSPQDTIASIIGLTAAKLVTGNTVLGVAGTASGGGAPALLCSSYFLPRSWGGSGTSSVGKSVNYYNSSCFNSSGTCISAGYYTIMRFAYASAQGDASSWVSIYVNGGNYGSTGVSASVWLPYGATTDCSSYYEGTGGGSDNKVVAVLAIFKQ